MLLVRFLKRSQVVQLSESMVVVAEVAAVVVVAVVVVGVLVVVQLEFSTSLPACLLSSNYDVVASIGTNGWQHTALRIFRICSFVVLRQALGIAVAISLLEACM